DPLACARALLVEEMADLMRERQFRMPFLFDSNFYGAGRSRVEIPIGAVALVRPLDLHGDLRQLSVAVNLCDRGERPLSNLRQITPRRKSQPIGDRLACRLRTYRNLVRRRCQFTRRLDNRRNNIRRFYRITRKRALACFRPLYAELMIVVTPE